MRRREFITLFGGIACSFSARAQQSISKPRLVAILDSASGNNDYLAAFREQIASLGWHEGSDLRLEIRQAGADANQARTLAAELVALKPDVFFANNLPTAQSILANTHDIPVVFIQIPDPVGSGLVMNFARPGGNVTGFTNFEPSIAGKWLEFLKDVAPDLNRVAVILDAGISTQVQYEKAIDSAATTFAVKVSPLILRDGAGIVAAVEVFAREPDGGLIVSPSALSVTYRDHIIGLAARYRLPTIYPYSDFVSAGGLLSYGIDRNTLYKQAATYVDRILKGEKAADLPVQAPTKFELVVNVKTAKALGLTIPQPILSLANEVIE
jgi:putative ABC transport system substrate-binding protein